MTEIEKELENLYANLEKLLKVSFLTVTLSKLMPEGMVTITSGAFNFQKAKEILSSYKSKNSPEQIEDYAKLVNNNVKIMAQNSIDVALLLAPLTYKKKVRRLYEDLSKYDLDKDELRKNADKLEFSDAVVHLLQLHKNGKTLKIDNTLLKTSPTFGDYSGARLEIINGTKAIILGLQRFMVDGKVVTGFVYDATVGEKEELALDQESRRELNLKDLTYFNKVIADSL